MRDLPGGRLRVVPRCGTALLLALALLMTLLPGAAGSASGQARGIGNVCEAPYASEFIDIAGSTHEDSVRCMADLDLAEGTGDGSAFSPRNEVTRAQTASFVARFIEHYTGEPLTERSQRFADVPVDFVHATNIHKLAQIGVTQGTAASDGEAFAPRQPVTRAQMASFISRATTYILEGQAQPETQPARVSDGDFPDTAGSVHEANIDALSAVGIVQGFGDGTYRPGAPVLRDQMASFVMRSYDWLIGQDVPDPPDPVEPTVAIVAPAADDPAQAQAGGDVTVTFTAEDSDAFAVELGADGTWFALDGPATGSVDDGQTTVTVTVPAGTDPGLYDLRVTVTNDDGTATDVVSGAVEVLPPDPTTGTVTGTVTDERTGDPVAGATVTLDGTAISTTTDADGAFTLSGIEPGTYSVTVSHPGYGEVTVRGVTVGPNQTVELDPIALDPDPDPGSVSGTVTDDATGAPVAGAEVALADTGYADVTDADGAYTLPDVARGTYDLMVTQDDYQDAVVADVAVGPGQDVTEDVALRALPGTVTVTVTDEATDVPVEGAEVTIADVDGTTDGDGHVVLTDITPGTYDLTVTADGYGDATEADVEVGANAENVIVDVTLTPLPGTVTGTVAVGVLDELPVEGVVVTATPTDGGDATTATTGADGEYDLELDPGTYDLTATLAGFHTATDTVTLTSNQQLPDQDLLLTSAVDGDFAITTQGDDIDGGEFLVGQTLPGVEVAFDRTDDGDEVDAKVSLTIRDGDGEQLDWTDPDSGIFTPGTLDELDGLLGTDAGDATFTVPAGEVTQILDGVELTFGEQADQVVTITFQLIDDRFLPGEITHATRLFHVEVERPDELTVSLDGFEPAYARGQSRTGDEQAAFDYTDSAGDVEQILNVLTVLDDDGDQVDDATVAALFDELAFDPADFIRGLDATTADNVVAPADQVVEVLFTLAEDAPMGDYQLVVTAYDVTGVDAGEVTLDDVDTYRVLDDDRVEVEVLDLPDTLNVDLENFEDAYVQGDGHGGDEQAVFTYDQRQGDVEQIFNVFTVLDDDGAQVAAEDYHALFDDVTFVDDQGDDSDAVRGLTDTDSADNVVVPASAEVGVQFTLEADAPIGDYTLVLTAYDVTGLDPDDVSLADAQAGTYDVLDDDRHDVEVLEVHDVTVEFRAADQGPLVGPLTTTTGAAIDLAVQVANHNETRVLDAGWFVGFEVEPFADPDSFGFERCDADFVDCTPVDDAQVTVIDLGGTSLIQIEGASATSAIPAGGQDWQHVRATFGEAGQFTGQVFVFEGR